MPAEVSILQQGKEASEDAILRDRFIELMVIGYRPLPIAERLAISEDKAMFWSEQLKASRRRLNSLVGLSPRDVGSSLPSCGLTLLQSADLPHALPGQVVTFSVWVLNETVDELNDVTLIIRSLSNNGMEPLKYLHCPSVRERRLGVLPPGASQLMEFSYKVAVGDRSFGGEITSALGVCASTPDGEVLWDECTVAVSMEPY